MNKKPKSEKAKKPKELMCLFLLFAFGILLFMIGCKDSTPPPASPGQVGAQLLEGAVYLPANVDQWYTYRIQVSDIAHAPDSIVCEVHRPDGSALPSFGLYDDGNTLQLSGPSYASPTSGDIAAHNGQFTRRINSRLLADSTVTGSYEFHFVFYGDAEYGMTNDGRLTVNVQNSGPCLLASVPSDSSFPECFSPETLQVHITKSQSDAVDSVRVRLLEGGNELNRADFAPLSGDTVWSMILNPTFFRCAASGHDAYTLNYEAETRFGASCSRQVTVADFTNARPSVFDPALPDTIQRPVSPTDTNRLVITVRLRDCEYLSTRDYDDYLVRYDSRREDTTVWNENPAFVMFDDAVAPDGHPFDGTYAGGISITHSNTLLDNLYYFRFYAIDCAPPHDTSAYVLDSVRVIQPSSPEMIGAKPSLQAVRTGQGAPWPTLETRR